MNALLNIIKDQIRTNGPISVAEYMQLCLAHPKYGYYITRDPLGAAGDFTTAPEISQIFGEMVGLWLAQYWMDIGAPTSFALTELGPGRGTLMSDIMRVTRGVSGFHDAAEIHLVETSPALRKEQKIRLNDYTPDWHNDMSSIPDLPLLLVANEFFDALPIRQFAKQNNQWHERLIGLSDDELSYGLGPAGPAPNGAADLENGAIFELCPAAINITQNIGAHIQRFGGAALIIDYAYTDEMRKRANGRNTFQALYKHEYINPLISCGEADLTAHVDYHALSMAAFPAHASSVVDQGDFLNTLGAAVRLESLQKSNPEKTSDLKDAYERLTGHSEMGSLFKVLALTASTAAKPIGF